MLELDHEHFELLLHLCRDGHILLGTAKDLRRLGERLITVGPRVLDHIFPELLQVCHISVHRHKINQELLWLEVVALGVLDLEFQAFLCGELIQAEVDGLCELLTQLLRHEGIRAVAGHLCKKLYDHVRELKRALGLSALIMEMLLSLLFLLITQLTPCVLVFLKRFVILDLFKGEKAIEEQTIGVIDQEVAE